MGEEPLKETKEKRERVGMMGELLTRHREHSGSRLSIKCAPLLLKHTYRHTLQFFSIRVQMHLEESKQPKKAQNPKCMSVRVCV